MGGRRPTFPRFTAVSSALPGLTSLFGMGRGAPRRHSRHMSLWKAWRRKEDGRKWKVESGEWKVFRFPFSVPIKKSLDPRVPAQRPDRRFRRASFRAISAARLNVSPRFHLRPIDVVVYHGPLRRPHLGESFALRCFQRLSQPDAATRRCVWRRNRCTVGPSDPVLSY